VDRTLTFDRWVVGGGLLAITAAGWLYLYRDSSANHCARMAEMAMPHLGGWGWTEFSLTFAMWTIMMAAMMVPSAAPIVLTFASVARRRRAAARPYAPTFVFLAGYLLVWAAFSLAATGAQWALHRLNLLSPEMRASSSILAALLLIVAGVFQWTRWKDACLTQCRSPLAFLMTEWREGTAGALRMGARHGAFCTGCCWAVMLLLFVAGVMNLAWVALIAALVLVEKIAPRARAVVHATGLLFVAAGAWMLVTALVR